MRILCLLPDSLEVPLPTTAKRIIPLMKKVEKRGHHIEFKENVARKKGRPGEYTYFLSRLNYTLSSVLREAFSDYDIVFVSKPEMLPLAYLLSKKLSIPFVQDLDDLEKISVLDLHGCFSSVLIMTAAKVFVASNELYRLYERKIKNVIYLPNTTDLQYFNPEKYGNIKKTREPTFLWVSDRIDWFTGCKLVFNSFARLKFGRLVIIGGGPKAFFEKTAKKLGMEKQVTVKGWVSDSELLRLYISSDIGLMPFTDNLWTRCKCSSRLFELMAMELPFICTVGEPAYMAKKLGCGIIAKPEPEDFTVKMKCAIDYLDELTESARQGREYLLEKQNFDVLADRLERELYMASKVKNARAAG